MWWEHGLIPCVWVPREWIAVGLSLDLLLYTFWPQLQLVSVGKENVIPQPEIATHTYPQHSHAGSGNHLNLTYCINHTSVGNTVTEMSSLFHKQHRRHKCGLIECSERDLPASAASKSSTYHLNYGGKAVDSDWSLDNVLLTYFWWKVLMSKNALKLVLTKQSY